MSRYGEYLIDKKTDWQQVQNEVAKSLAGVQNPVNEVRVPTLTQLSGGLVQGQGTYGGTYGVEVVPAPEAPPVVIDTQLSYVEPSMPVKTPERDVVSLVSEPVDAETIQNLLFENSNLY